MNEEKLRVLICLWLNKAELLTLLIIQNMQFVIMKDVKEWRQLNFNLSCRYADWIELQAL